MTDTRALAERFLHYKNSLRGKSAEEMLLLGAQLAEAYLEADRLRANYQDEVRALRDEKATENAEQRERAVKAEQEADHYREKFYETSTENAELKRQRDEMDDFADWIGEQTPGDVDWPGWVEEAHHKARQRRKLRPSDTGKE